MHNITLIGMPGSGKTTLGKTLAEGLSYHFIDTDDVIIETYGQPLMELIDKHGTEGFITLEGKDPAIHPHQPCSDLHRRQRCLQ